MKIVLLLNIFFLTILACLTFNSVKNIDKQAETLIKLNECKSTLKDQSKILKGLIVKDYIYQED